MQTRIEKRNASQQMLWQKIFVGKTTITDLEINSANHAIAIGWFSGTVAFDSFSLTSDGNYASGVVLEMDESGTILWAKKLNPVGNEFKLVDLYINAANQLYFSSALLGDAGFCSFHKASATGDLLKSEFNNNFENRTFSHILVDDTGNVYLSGTCGNGATFDDLHSDPAFSYQHFVVKYDSSFTAQWLHTRSYFTFDDNNELAFDGQNYYWVFDEMEGSVDTVRIVKLNPGGTIVRTVDAPLASAYFLVPNFSIDKAGNSTLLFNYYYKYYLFHFNADFEIVHTDSIKTQGGNLGIMVECYDSTVYVAGCYGVDTLRINNLLLQNQNIGTSFPTDVFVSCWSNQSLLTETQRPILPQSTLFPNPVTGNKLTIKSTDACTHMVLSDATGRKVMELQLSENESEVDVSRLRAGVYSAQLTSSKGYRQVQKITVVR